MKKYLKYLVFLISFTLLFSVVYRDNGNSTDAITLLGPQFTPSDEPPITTTSSDAIYGVPFLDDLNPESFITMEGLPRGTNGGYITPLIDVKTRYLWGKIVGGDYAQIYDTFTATWYGPETEDPYSVEAGAICYSRINPQYEPIDYEECMEQFTSTE